MLIGMVRVPGFPSALSMMEERIPPMAEALSASFTAEPSFLVCPAAATNNSGHVRRSFRRQTTTAINTAYHAAPSDVDVRPHNCRPPSKSAASITPFCYGECDWTYELSSRVHKNT